MRSEELRYRFAMIMKLDNRGKSDESITASVAVDLVANFSSMDAGTACRALPAYTILPRKTQWAK